MRIINNNIKVVIWDLDNTLWKGVLAEGEEVILNLERINIIDVLNHRGIVNAICSKNNKELVEKKLEELEIKDKFVFVRADFMPKGKIINDILSDMNLRSVNALFVDDELSNLNEVIFYNPNINVISAEECDGLLELPELAGKDDSKLTRLKQYRQLEEKCEIKKEYSDNDAFLHSSNIRIKMIGYNDTYFSRVYELSERTNQLNFTKNRMGKNELHDFISKKDVETKLISVDDRFGDYGIVGFYSLKDNQLIHFVFSCRIMNMGIEQFVYEMLNYPDINIIGETAVNIGRPDKRIDYITVIDEKEDVSNENIDCVMDDNKKIKVIAVGACDLFNPMVLFNMPNIEFVYECNVFLGDERGVNVGTEYLRSQLEMNDIEKDYCRYHFKNYRRYNVFDSKLFSEEWDYVIMSFHDDMIYQTYTHKQDANLRISLSPAPVFGKTSIENINGKEKADYPIQMEWLSNNFFADGYISEDRFKDNIMYISEHIPQKTKFMLITGPELDYFREELPECEEARTQILKINKAIRDICIDFPDKFALVEMNNVVRSVDDISNYIFHLKSETGYMLFLEIINAMITHFSVNNGIISDEILKGREIIIFDGDLYSLTEAYFHLMLAGYKVAHFIHFQNVGDVVWDIPIEHCADYLSETARKKYYIIVSDTIRYSGIRQLLINHGFEVKKDFIQYKMTSYQLEMNDIE